jgi:hypothetical protein
MEMANFKMYQSVFCLQLCQGEPQQVIYLGTEGDSMESKDDPG